MPYKNDNLEELFQKAADDYPLRTNSSNWNSVATKLNTPASENAAVKKTNAWKYAAILFFLMTGGALLYLSQYKTTGKTSSLTGTQANSKAKKDQGNNIQAVQPPKQNLNNTINNFEVSSSSKTKTALTNVSNGITVKPGGDYLLLKNADKNLKAGSNSSALLNLQIAPVIVQNQNQLPTLSMLKKDITEANQNVINDASINNIEGSKTSVIKLQQPKFYGSLYAGPEFSIIKSQRINSPGFKAGIALAYRINKRFDIEIGLQREWINYFTTGQYFDKTGLNIKHTVALESLNAKSSLTSIPVTVRYNFASKNSGHFYTGVGFNTLVLTHTESYQYTVNKNGNENDRSKNYKSVTGPKYFTSINTGIGYQNKLNNWCNYKVEPYYQIPVGNLGVGKLPVTSFGINVGIVKNLR